jgi:hypothetical protein
MRNYKKKQKQTQNDWESRRIEHRSYSEIVADITTRN